ncbi:MAG: VanW family protein [Clostridia bacterium]|nr:VanW family protein [Clostridia bacterium]
MRKKTLKYLFTLLLAGAFFLVIPIKIGYFSKAEAGQGVSVQNTRAENPYGWEKISAYTTYFNQNDGGRCENIQIAASLIDGVTIQPYGEFSFNATVGRRTAEAGFQQAKIIVNGEYVLGVGGGVCQVSTTLYNAALKSGLQIIEYHPHSLQVGYVAPSRDAMVSSQSDLKFFNPHAHAVYLSAKTKNGAIQISFYGKRIAERYELSSQTLEQIPAPAPIVKEGRADEVLRAEKQGVKSELYLERYVGDKLIARIRLRTDEYRPIQGIIVKKVGFTTEKDLSNVCLFYEKML